MNKTEKPKTIANKIIKIVEKFKFSAAEATETSNLYFDLGYDSLAFVGLLLEIEKTFSINFNLLEMGECIEMERLIFIALKKVAELKND